MEDKLTDSITYATSQRWEYCLPLLMDLEYISKLRNSYSVVKEKWNNFNLFQDPEDSINFSCHHPKREKYGTCVGAIPRIKDRYNKYTTTFVDSEIDYHSRIAIMLHSKLQYYTNKPYVT